MISLFNDSLSMNQSVFTWSWSRPVPRHFVLVPFTTFLVSFLCPSSLYCCFSPFSSFVFVSPTHTLYFLLCYLCVSSKPFWSFNLIVYTPLCSPAFYTFCQGKSFVHWAFFKKLLCRVGLWWLNFSFFSVKAYLYAQQVVIGYICWFMHYSHEHLALILAVFVPSSRSLAGL